MKRRKKKRRIWFSVLLAVLAFSSCTTNENAVQDTEEAPKGGQTLDSTAGDIGADDFLCTDVELIETSETGVTATYEEMQDIIGIYSEKVNFVIFEILEFCSEEEIEQFEEMNADETTLYKARIEYDCLNNEPADRIIYLAKAGNFKIQPVNQPIYNIGEKYAAMLMNLAYDSWNVALPELTFACKEENDTECLYQINFDLKFISADGKELGTELIPEKQYLYTTTSNNPVKYTRSFETEELSDYLKKDWIQRGYVIHSLDDRIFDTDTSGYSYTEDGDVIPLNE